MRVAAEAALFFAVAAVSLSLAAFVEAKDNLDPSAALRIGVKVGWRVAGVKLLVVCGRAVICITRPHVSMSPNKRSTGFIQCITHYKLSVWVSRGSPGLGLGRVCLMSVFAVFLLLPLLLLFFGPVPPGVVRAALKER